ncbi:hypothetical protein QJQ45_029617 [Haematococcus lacustris]|nr:hypothetical protein QJQ45_029617 [Haematococcus lacustris]
MATRTRPARAFDVNKQLPIVRDISELDTTEGLPKVEGQDGGLKQERQDTGLSSFAPHAMGKGALLGFPASVTVVPKKPKAKDIPVPEVKEVPTYTRDYLPTFKIPTTYIHGKGGVPASSEESVEYDLDNEDEDWLEALNCGGACRLSDTKFESMLWRLELLWSECFEALPSDRSSAAALTSIACVPKHKAMVMLKWAAVFEYWAAKRRRLAKPILRRLQAPTNPNDTDPYHVFRPRERPNRPLLRRRRENTAECLDKLRHMQASFLRVLQMAELVVLRERKKRDVHHLDMTLQRCQVCLHHRPRPHHAGLEAEALQRLHLITQRSSLINTRINTYCEAQAQPPGGALDTELRSALVRKKARMDAEQKASTAVSSLDALAAVPPPLPPPALEPLFAFQPDLLALLGPTLGSTPPEGQEEAGQKLGSGAQGLAAGAAQLPVEVARALAAGAAQAYIARGGRLAIARVDPLTLKPLGGPREPEAVGVSAGGGAQPALRLGNTAGSTGAAATSKSAAAGGGGRAANGAEAGAAGTSGSGAQLITPSQAVRAPAEPDWALGPHALAPSIAFPSLDLHTSQPWAACLDLALLPDCIDRAAFLAQRSARAAPPDYPHHLGVALAALQAQQHPSFGPPPAPGAALGVNAVATRDQGAATVGPGAAGARSRSGSNKAAAAGGSPTAHAAESGVGGRAAGAEQRLLGPGFAVPDHRLQWSKTRPVLAPFLT